MSYKPPIDDMMFTLRHVVGLDGIPAAEGLAADDIRLVLESAGTLASEVIAPLNHSADKEGSRRNPDGSVTTPKGYRDAYIQYRDGGWNGVPFNPDYGGQGLPWVLAFPVAEMWQSADLSFSLCPMLNQGAVEAIDHHGNDEQKKLYLTKLISGEWTGTMNLTEPSAGSDLSAVRTRAEPAGDGTYKIFGQKIFITFGEHDFTDNIVHLVLARLPNAPEGTKGISLFIVPKFIPDASGKPGKRNDVQCVSLEHKLGIHGSPTCTMQYGDAGGAIGWLIGKEHEGIKYMFTMMNNARLSVGLQGVALAERAYQRALAFAKERKQGTKIGSKSGDRVAIIEHPDVRRMLLAMKVRVEAGRMLAYEAARYLDRANAGDKAAQDRVDLLTPVVKGWCTDMAREVSILGVQVHGGMGFIEETGAAQYVRDSMILPIYEGTNGIQAMDMAFRKTLLNEGAFAKAWFDDASDAIAHISEHDEMKPFARTLAENLEALREAELWILAHGKDAAAIAAVSTPYLEAFGIVAGGIMMARAASAAKAANDVSVELRADKILSARFYGDHVLPRALGLSRSVCNGADAVLAFKG